MSEINPLGSSFYFSGLQNAANRAAKNEKKRKNFFVKSKI